MPRIRRNGIRGRRGRSAGMAASVIGPSRSFRAETDSMHGSRDGPDIRGGAAVTLANKQVPSGAADGTFKAVPACVSEGSDETRPPEIPPPDHRSDAADLVVRGIAGAHGTKCIGDGNRSARLGRRPA